MGAEPVHDDRNEVPQGKDDWIGAARLAAACRSFCPDEEDEQVADEPRSCYNCRYRRWTVASFSCYKEMAAGR